MSVTRYWYDIEPAEAVDIRLPRADIIGPVNEVGEECPWPWDPPQLAGMALGMYHCPYCGAMCIAGIAHIDHRTVTFI